jgi:hypothetical protein
MPVAEDVGLDHHLLTDYALGGKPPGVDLRRHVLDHYPLLSVFRLFSRSFRGCHRPSLSCVVFV